MRTVLGDPEETYFISSGGAQRSSNAPAVIPLASGVNTTTVTVTSDDSKTLQAKHLPWSLPWLHRPPTSRWPSWYWAERLPTSGNPTSLWTRTTTTCAPPHSTLSTAVLPQTSHRAATFVVATEPPEALNDNGYGTTLVELAEGATTTVTVTVTAEEVTTVRLRGAHRQGRPATFRMK